MAPRKSKEPKLPKDWVDADPGLWMTTQPLAAKFEDGNEEILPEGTVVDLDYPKEIYESYLPGTEYETDESIPYTNWDDNTRSYMKFHGKIGGRKFEFVEPINAGNGGPFGLSNGVHYVRVGPLKPLSFPEYLPDGVELPPFWSHEKATKEDMCFGGPSGFYLDHSIGKRWLPCFKVEINDTYYGYVSIDAPSLKTEHYWGRKDMRKKGSVPRKTLADFLAAAESLIFTVKPHAQYPLHGKTSVRFPVSELPSEWLEQMEYQERYDTDDEFRAEHYRKRDEDLRTKAFEKYRAMTWEEARTALSAGAFIEKIKYQRADSHFDAVEVYAVIGEDVFKWGWLRNDRPAETFVIGLVPDEQIKALVQDAKDHFNGLQADSQLRIKRPNKRDQYVIAGDSRAESAPYITARNLIAWTAAGSGTSKDGNRDWWTWKGRTMFGGNWDMNLSKAADCGWRASHDRSRGRYQEGCDETDIHNYDNWGVSFKAESFEEAFKKAQDVALTEEVSHLIGGGWYAAKAGIGDFSTDLLELVALYESKELGYTGDRSRRRHQPLPHRLAAIVWELKRRGSKIGWDLLDDSLGADLMEEYEDDL